MKALCMVAHPDDCVIFAHHFIHTHHYDWTIAYLTYDTDSERARELATFWSQRSVPTIFLGCPDQWADTVEQVLHFDVADYQQRIHNLVNQYQLILTHNHYGEYGHIHHKFVHQTVSDTPVPQIYFASDYDCNLELTVTPLPYQLSELPLHQEVLAGIHDLTTARYMVTPDAQKIMDTYT
jgi:hypothetical protein